MALLCVENSAMMTASLIGRMSRGLLVTMKSRKLLDKGTVARLWSNLPKDLHNTSLLFGTFGKHLKMLLFYAS